MNSDKNEMFLIDSLFISLSLINEIISILVLEKNNGSKSRLDH